MGSEKFHRNLRIVGSEKNMEKIPNQESESKLQLTPAEYG